MKIKIATQEELDCALREQPGATMVLTGTATFRLAGMACPYLSVGEGDAPRVVARESSAPRIEAWESSAPRIEAWESSAPRVVAWESSAPTVEAWGSSAPRVVARESSAPRIEAWESSAPTVEAWGSSAPRVVARGSSAPTVEAWESSAPTVEAWGSSAPRVVARGSSAPRIVARESSAPRVEAWGSSAPRVVARESSAPTVEAPCGHIVAHDAARVTASRTTAVHRRSRKVQITGGTVIDVLTPTTPLEWCAFHAVTVTDGVAVLYKAVRDDYRSARGFLYKPGTTDEAPDWDGGREECGGGLHFAAHPELALGFDAEATRFVACPVALADMRAPHDGDEYPDKIKAHRVCAPMWEVDRNGVPLAAAR